MREKLPACRAPAGGDSTLKEFNVYKKVLLVNVYLSNQELSNWYFYIIFLHLWHYSTDKYGILAFNKIQNIVKGIYEMVHEKK